MGYSERTPMGLLEACMAPQHPALHPLYPLTLYTHEPQAHLQEHVLHSEICSHASNGYVFWLLAFLATLGREQVECTGLVQADIGWCDPLALTVVLVGRVVVYWFRL